MCVSPVVQTSSYGGEEELHLEVRVEYVCDPSAVRNTLAGSIPGSRAGRWGSTPAQSDAAEAAAVQSSTKARTCTASLCAWPASMLIG